MKANSRLQVNMRRWHRWGGLIAGGLLVVVASSGIILNYKKPVFTALGLERADTERIRAGTAYAGRGNGEKRARDFTTITGAAAAEVSLDQALALARENWGATALERIELKDEHGTLLYKLKSRKGQELQINAVTGAHFLKGEYEKVRVARDGAEVTRTTDWGKVMIDLHTGKIGGEVGKALMSVSAALVIFLTGSGIYMWLKPLLIRRRAAKLHALTARGGGPAPVTPIAAQTARSELVDA